MCITPVLLESTPKVCKHGDRWNLVYVENGKQHRKYIGKGSLTQKEAERKANEMIARLMNGDAPKETKGDTLKELLTEVLETHLLELRKETVAVFRCTMSKILQVHRRKRLRGHERGKDHARTDRSVPRGTAQIGESQHGTERSNEH